MSAVEPPQPPINLRDYAGAARGILSPMALGYFAAGARDEITLRDNRMAYDQLKLRYRVMRGVGDRDLATTVLGAPVAFPALVAPMAFQRLAHDEGELATVRGAGSAGTVTILSTLATTAVEDVCAAATGPVWFQLYIYKDRGATRDLVARAEAAGCTALVVTVDAPVLGTREADVRSRFGLPGGLRAQNLVAHGAAALPAAAEGSGLAAYVYAMLDADITWADIGWLRGITDLPIVVKGVVRGDDARMAVDAGVAGLVVSNHGGRQLDTAPATIHVLPEVVDAVAGRVEVLVDGGIRRGTDMVKALALGARAVLVGRPVLWGLAVSGQAGVESVLGILRDELDEAMALCGCRTVDDLAADLIWRPPWR